MDLSACINGGGLDKTQCRRAVVECIESRFYKINSSNPCSGPKWIVILDWIHQNKCFHISHDVVKWRHIPRHHVGVTVIHSTVIRTPASVGGTVRQVSNFSLIKIKLIVIRVLVTIPPRWYVSQHAFVNSDLMKIVIKKLLYCWV